MDCLAFYWMIDAQPLANLEADVMKVMMIILYKAHVITTQQNKMKALIARKGQRSPRDSELILCCIAFLNIVIVSFASTLTFSGQAIKCQKLHITILHTIVHCECVCV